MDGTLKHFGLLFEMRLSHEQEKRNVKGNSNEQRSDHRRSKTVHTETSAFSDNERDQNKSLYDDIRTKTPPILLENNL
jgi:hypothetical protein